MKLFQIEEPDGGPIDSDAPGAAVGIDLASDNGSAVAIALGGNAEILPGADGERRLPAAPLATLLGQLRQRAERQLARPVTHAVIAVVSVNDGARTAIEAACAAAGLTMLGLVDEATATAALSGAGDADRVALGAAILAEEAAAARAG